MPRFGARTLERVEWLLGRYPRSQAATLPVLRLAQEEFGFLSDEVMEYVASLVKVPPIEVYQTASFYTLFFKEKVGRHKVWLCTNISCFLLGSDRLLEHCARKLGIGPGQTTPDGRVSLFSVECLAHCDHAPCAQVDEEYVGPLDEARLERILEGLS